MHIIFPLSKDTGNKKVDMNVHISCTYKICHKSKAPKAVPSLETLCMCVSVSCFPLYECMMALSAFLSFSLPLSAFLPAVNLGLRWSCTQTFHGGSYKHLKDAN